jgi:hypothetical protein
MQIFCIDTLKAENVWSKLKLKNHQRTKIILSKSMRCNKLQQLATIIINSRRSNSNLEIDGITVSFTQFLYF